MKPFSAEGQELDAEFSVEEADDSVSLFFESSSGGAAPRNTQYNEGLRALLDRLQELGASISVFLASTPALQVEEGERTLLTLTDLSGRDLGKLQGEIQSAAAGAVREEGASGSGNNTKRLELRLSLPTPIPKSRLTRLLQRRPVRDPVLKVLVGPPGTGKTYRAAREAVAIVDGREPDINEAHTRHAKLVQEGRIFWVTFHPSYSYEDFVEGFRPVRSEDGDPVFQVVDGPFKEACRAARPTIRVGDRLRKYEVVDVDAGGVVLRSEVSRKDGVVPRLEQYADFWTVERLRSRGILPESLSLGGERNEERQEVAKLTGLPTTLLTNSSHLRAVMEALQEHEGEDQEVVLVIDEINRADLSRVFGELITLLEKDKREGAPEETRVTLPYSKAPFVVPRGLSIVATMNTADRSLSVFDLALRRRFDFVEILPDPALCPSSYAEVDVRDLLTRWNRRICALLSRDMTIGHAELMESKFENVRVSRGWEDGSDGKLRALATVLREKVLPLLMEYFHGDYRRVVFCFGKQLLDVDSFQDLDASELEELGVDAEELGGVDIPPWWDPNSGSWDAGRFRGALGGGDVPPTPADT